VNLVGVPVERLPRYAHDDQRLPLKEAVARYHRAPRAVEGQVPGAAAPVLTVPKRQNVTSTWTWDRQHNSLFLW